MVKVETPAEISRRWKREGRTYTSRDVTAEFTRQGETATRAREDDILATAAAIDPADQSTGARHLQEVAGSIRDHRAANLARLNWSRDPDNGED